MKTLAPLLLMLGALGCQCAQLDDRLYACSPAGECPEGLTCFEGQCIPPGDAGSLDSGRPDAGSSDAGTPDAGNPDAGAPDAGPQDAGPPVPGDTCATALPIDWGSWGNTATITGTLVGARDDLNGGLCFTSASELFFSFVANAPITATVNSGNVQVALRDACDAGLTQCMPAQLGASADAGRYLLVVENRGDAGPFSVTLDRTGAPSPDDCTLADSPAPVPDAGPLIFRGSSDPPFNTSGNHDCKGRSFSDGLKLAVRLRTAGSLSVSVDAGNEHAVFFLGARCGRADAGLECTRSSGGPMTFPMLDAGVYWLTVGPDSSTATGPFEVVIRH